MEIQNPENQNYNPNYNNPNSNPNSNNRPQPAIPPKTWLVESILATLFCCLPFGIVGIVQASKVESSFYAGRVEEAERASRDAKKWTVISFWVGLAVAILYLLYILVIVGLGIGGVLGGVVY